MLFLSPNEVSAWEAFTLDALATPSKIRAHDGEIRPNLLACFRFHVASALAAGGAMDDSMAWFKQGAMEESEDLMSNAFILSFLQRQGGRFAVPERVFADPRPFIHFAGIPAIRESRSLFLKQAAHSLPRFDHPLSFADVGCGDGALGVALLRNLVVCGKAPGVGDIHLVDASPAMLDMAVCKAHESFPKARVHTCCQTIQECSQDFAETVDVALMSLAYHHMPVEVKRVHLERMGRSVRHFLVFELDANHDAPELRSPEISVSIYQTYGRMIDAVFAHDATIDVAQSCVDRFLLAETVSLLTQPRGVRTEYHMLRRQWHDLFRETLGESFTCLCDATAYAHEYLDLFTLHYGRDSDL